jgi:hypothetical protein
MLFQVSMTLNFMKIMNKYYINEIILNMHFEIWTRKCLFRAAICYQWKTDACNGVSVPLKDFAKHLEEKHKCLKYKDQSSYIKYPTAKDKFGIPFKTILINRFCFNVCDLFE